MKKSEMVDYLRRELEKAHSDYLKAKTEYEQADHMDRIGMSHSYDKIEDRYFYLYMLCNDLGVI